MVESCLTIFIGWRIDEVNKNHNLLHVEIIQMNDYFNIDSQRGIKRVKPFYRVSQ